MLLSDSPRHFQWVQNSSAQFGDNTNPVEISAPQNNCSALKCYNQSVRFIWSTAVELSLTRLQSDRIQKSAYQDGSHQHRRSESILSKKKKNSRCKEEKLSKQLATLDHLLWLIVIHPANEIKKSDRRHTHEQASAPAGAQNYLQSNSFSACMQITFFSLIFFFSLLGGWNVPPERSQWGFGGGVLARTILTLRCWVPAKTTTTK